MKLLIVLGGGAMLLIPLTPMNSSTQAQSFDRRAMLENIGNNIIMLAHADFLAQTEVFQQSPSLETLAMFQGEWVETSLGWQWRKLFNFEHLLIYHSPIEKASSSPVNTEFIEQTILGTAVIDEAFIEGSGSNVKGLPVLEYLLFTPEQDNKHLLQAFTNLRRLDYLVAVAENLHRKAGEVYPYWLPEGKNYPETFVNAAGEGSNVRESVSMLTNQIASVVENVIQMRLGLPLGKTTGGTPQPELAEGQLSNTTVLQIIVMLESEQQTFNGGEAFGLDDYLVFLNTEYPDKPLSVKINEQLDSIIVALADLEQPLEVAVIEQTDQVDTIYISLRVLVRLIKSDIVGHLGVTITFNDNDED